MTEQQFDKYLESIGGLIDGKTSESIISHKFFAFGQGWYAITKELIDDLIKLGWDRSIYQAKEKYGAGRFYIGGATKEVFDRIREWEQLTFTVCEHCGDNTTAKRRPGSWVLTLCDECLKIPVKIGRFL